MRENERFLKAYEDFSDAIFRHCYFRVSNRERAKDIMQETFLKVWAYIAEGNRIEHMKAFLYRVANNMVIDEYKKKKTYSLEKLQEQGFEPGIDERSRIEHSIEVKQVMKFIEALPNDDRDLFIMRYIDDLGPKEISALLNETENAVSVRLHRGLKKLKEKIRYA